MPTPRAARFRKPKLNSNTPNPLLNRICERHYPQHRKESHDASDEGLSRNTSP
jgi:hypothetical protein